MLEKEEKEVQNEFKLAPVHVTFHLNFIAVLIKMY